MSIEIVDQAYHGNGSGEPFVAAIIDDPNEGDTKLVVVFEEPGCTAVLSLDSLIQDEDISSRNSHNGGRYDKALRDLLWEDRR